MGMKCISENQRTILDVLLMNGVFFNAVNLPAPSHFLFYSFWRIFFQGRPNSGVSCSNAEALFYSPIYQWSRKPKCAWTQNQIKILITLVLQLNIQCWPMFIFHLSRLLPLMSIFFNYTNTIFVLYFEFVWWGGLTLPANLLKGPAFHFSDHYMEKLLLIWLESLSDLEYASLWEFKQMKTIYFNSEFSAEVFFFSYYTKFFQNAYVSEMFV